MGMFDIFKSKPKKKRLQSNARREQAVNAIIASYQDAAGDDPAIGRHFENASAGSHSAIFDKGLRDELMEKARFEVANNPNLKGIVSTKATDIVGRKPKLRFLPETGSISLEVKISDSLSKKFSSWAKHVSLGEKLRTACIGKIVDGESFIFAGENSESTHQVKLDIRLFDPERVINDPEDVIVNKKQEFFDGIKFDSFNNPVLFNVLRDHPNDAFNQSYLKPFDFMRVSNKYIYQWYRKDRPEQRRGVSELATALPVAAVLRRTRKAVALSNEIAASIAFLLETSYDGDEVVDGDGNVVDSSAYGGFQKVSYEAGTSMVLPDGVTAKQLEAKHPNTTYSDFHNSCINDIGRSIGLPFNKAAGRSSDYNYSSARLDHLMDDFGNTVCREELIDGFLDPVLLRLWIAFATESEGYLTEGERRYLTRSADLPKHSWSFDTYGHLDPVKEAQGDNIKCASGSSNRAHILMQEGYDLDQHDAMAAEAYGFNTIQEYRQAVASATFGLQVDQSESDSSDTQEGE